MPSTNPDRTARIGLPSPKPADPPDVPGDVKALADAVSHAIQYGNVVIPMNNSHAAQGTITFNPPFAGPPSVVASNDDSRFNTAVAPAPTASGATIHQRALDGQPTQQQQRVWWIAVGPLA